MLCDVAVLQIKLELDERVRILHVTFSNFIKSVRVKGQLISKCPFGVIVSTKIPTKKFDKFCPRI